MSIDTQKTVAEIAPERPQAAAVFEKLGIDHCCGGRKPLAAACEEVGIDMKHVADLLEKISGTDQWGAEAENWSNQSLANHVNRIVQKQHVYCRKEGFRLRPLLAKVVSKHAKRHPDLERIQELFASLQGELSMHMMEVIQRIV